MSYPYVLMSCPYVLMHPCTLASVLTPPWGTCPPAHPPPCAGTSSAAGKWSDVAASLLPAGTGLLEAADLLYRLNAAMYDASVVCW